MRRGVQVVQKRQHETPQRTGMQQTIKSHTHITGKRTYVQVHSDSHTHANRQTNMQAHSEEDAGKRHTVTIRSEMQPVSLRAGFGVCG